MFEIMPEVPLFFKALILLGFIVLMVGIAGLVLLIGKNKQAKQSDTYDIVKKSKKTAKTKNIAPKKVSDKPIEEWDEEPVGSFGKKQAPAPAPQPTVQQTFAPAPAPAPQPTVQQTFAPAPAPQPTVQETPPPVIKPATGGPFGQSKSDSDESEW